MNLVRLLRPSADCGLSETNLSNEKITTSISSAISDKLTSSTSISLIINHPFRHAGTGGTHHRFQFALEAAPILTDGEHIGKFTADGVGNAVRSTPEPQVLLRLGKLFSLSFQF